LGLVFLFFLGSAISAAAADAALVEEQPGAAGRGQAGPQGVWILHQPMSLLGYNVGAGGGVKGSKGRFLYVQEKAKPC